jgi:hypothetical protein
MELAELIKKYPTVMINAEYILRTRTTVHNMVVSARIYPDVA